MINKQELLAFFNNDYENKINENELSNITTKGFLGKWLSFLVFGARNCLRLYYLSNDSGKSVEDIEDEFEYTLTYTVAAETLLEDLVAFDLDDIPELCDKLIKIMSVLYDNDSDEIYILKEFFRVYDNIYNWDVSDMWSEKCDDRLLSILNSNYKIWYFLTVVDLLLRLLLVLKISSSCFI